MTIKQGIMRVSIFRTSLLSWAATHCGSLLANVRNKSLSASLAPGAMSSETLPGSEPSSTRSSSVSLGAVMTWQATCSRRIQNSHQGGRRKGEGVDLDESCDGHLVALIYNQTSPVDLSPNFPVVHG